MNFISKSRYGSSDMLQAAQRAQRKAELTLALHELQIISCESPSDDISNALEDTRRELEAL